jgi:hypothetical protein
MLDWSSNTVKPLPSLEYPKFRWRWEFWLTFIPYLFLFLKPPLYIKVVLFLVPLVVPTLFWLVHVTIVLVKRAKLYPKAYSSLHMMRGDLASLHRDFVETILQFNVSGILEITRVAYVKGNLYLTLSKPPRKILNIGDEVVVVDTQDAKLMGFFQITEFHARDCYAKGVKEVDKLWLGYVQLRGEVHTLPDMVAIIQQKEAHDE